MYGQTLAVCAGFCAALASLAAKVAFSEGAVSAVCQTATVSIHHLAADINHVHFCPQVF